MMSSETRAVKLVELHSNHRIAQSMLTECDAVEQLKAEKSTSKYRHELEIGSTLTSHEHSEASQKKSVWE